MQPVTTFLLVVLLLLNSCKNKSSEKKEEKKDSTSNTTVPVSDPHPTMSDSVGALPTVTETKTEAAPPMMVIHKLAEEFSGDSALLQTGENEFITVFAGETEANDNAEEALGVTCPDVNNAMKCKSDIFQGCIRGKVKTTMITGEPLRFKTIRELLTRLKNESPDADMKSKNISSMENSVREPEERKNVQILTAYLYSIYREPDNDYHLIIGDSPVFSNSVLMNVEVSAIPRGASQQVAARFMKVRNKITESIIGNVSCSSNPFPRNNPLKITNLTGTLYFDNPHDAGSVGRDGLHAASAWEIHPIIDLTVGRFVR